MPHHANTIPYDLRVLLMNPGGVVLLFHSKETQMALIRLGMVSLAIWGNWVPGWSSV